MDPITFDKPCTCPPGKCSAEMDPEHCIGKLAPVSAEYCTNCGCYAWHKLGECLRCNARLREAA